MTQLYWDQVEVGDTLNPISFPLSVYRMVVAAGAVRDFNSIHHNTEVAQAGGARDMYANTGFLQSMWERAIREYMGLRGELRKISGFKMVSFNCAGDTVIVKGAVERKWQDAGTGFVELRMWSENGDKTSVGPGLVTITLPTRNGE